MSVSRRLQLRDFSEKVIDTKAAGYSVPPQYQYQYPSGISAGGASGGVGAGIGVGGGVAGSNAQMEVDSNASTPA